MKTLFDVTDYDKKFYVEKIKDFLPDKIIDFHTHVWKKEHENNLADIPLGIAKWPSMVASENTIEDLMQTYSLMFPDKDTNALIFASPSQNTSFEKSNTYISEMSKKYGFPGLFLSHPDFTGEKVENEIIDGGFYGCKVYLNFSKKYIPANEIRIFDFLPRHQLKIMNRHGWIVMLHIPRSGRLKDPVNIAQILEITQKYPDIKLIIAHVGRAYCNEDVGNAFKKLVKADKIFFDISANSNQWVFEQLINAVGPKRILFGSDLPILRMRTRRICENGKYINLVPKGLYGDVSIDTHMREVESEKVKNLTFFLYEEIDAFRRAAVKTGLGKADISDIFYNNAADLLNQIRKNGGK